MGKRGQFANRPLFCLAKLIFSCWRQSCRLRRCPRLHDVLGGIAHAVNGVPDGIGGVMHHIFAAVNDVVCRIFCGVPGGFGLVAHGVPGFVQRISGVLGHTAVFCG